MTYYRLGVCALLFSASLAVSGCETAKGVTQGLGCLGCAAGSTAQGLVKDVRSTPNVIKIADDWIKKNLW